MAGQPRGRAAGSVWVDRHGRLAIALLRVGVYQTLLEAVEECLKRRVQHPAAVREEAEGCLGASGSQEVPKASVYPQASLWCFHLFSFLKNREWSREESGRVRNPCLPPCVSVSLLQDNPEIEKRDPQELVGEYPAGGLGGTFLSLAQSKRASSHTGPAAARCTRLLGLSRGSCSARSLVSSGSQGLGHFLSGLGKTPRE